MKRFPVIRDLGRDTRVHLIILVLILVFINTKGIRQGEIWAPDGGLHAMNGAFILDLVKAWPIGDLYNYTLEYFARYPALSLGYHPPFFPVVEAGFFAIGGISVMTARFAVLFFGIIATIFWYRLATMMYEKKIAFLSTLFLFSSPLIVKYSREVMLELPALALVILSAYAFYNFVERDRRNYVYLLTISLVLAFLTKQTTIFLLPCFILYLAFTRNFDKLLNKETLFSSLFLLLCVTSFMIMTFLFAKTAISYNVTFSMKDFYGYEKLSWQNLGYYIRILPEIVSLPVIVLSILSLYIAVTKRTSRTELFLFLWIMTNYLFITYISAKEKRFAFFLLPPISLLAALALFEIPIRLKKIKIALPLAFMLGAFQIAQANSFDSNFIRGYEKAAKYIADNPQGFSIVIDGYYSNNFIFQFRKHDNLKHNIILRGRKLFQEQDAEEFGSEELLQVLRDYGVKYVIIESHAKDKQVEFRRQAFMKLLETENFIKVNEIKVETNLSVDPNLSILIYILKGEVELNKKFLELSLAGKKISFPIERLLSEKQHKRLIQMR